jgi:hypothetical protein
MSAQNPSRPSRSALDYGLRAGIVGLTLATGYIHFTLGGLLFTANAAGYATLAVAMALPIALASRFRWLIRPALASYAAATIAGWLVMGPHFQLAYIAKGIELALIALVVVEMFRYDGGPLAVARRFFGEVARVARVVTRSATGSAQA